MDNTQIEQLKNFRILCVEDEAGIRRRLVRTLEYYFDEVIEAADGEEGLDRFYETRPDLILTDIEMPRSSGVEMVRLIREIDRHVPIVMVTAYSNEEYLLELINLNISHYILKPVNATNLLEGLLHALEERLIHRIDLANDLYYDLRRGELLYRDRPIPLRRRDRRFLLLLHRHHPAITTYDQIADHLWDDKPMSRGALKTFIKELRSRLPVDIIENVPREGYRLRELEIRN